MKSRTPDKTLVLSIFVSTFFAIASLGQSLPTRKPLISDPPKARFVNVQTGRGYSSDGQKKYTITTTTHQRGKAFTGLMVVYVHVKGASGTDYFAKGEFRQIESSTRAAGKQRLEKSTDWEIRITTLDGTDTPLSLKNYILEYYHVENGNRELLASRKSENAASLKAAVDQGNGNSLRVTCEDMAHKW